jgi:hypothetical protein
MLPVYNEYISMLKSKGVPADLKEGYLWIDNQIIKGFDLNGSIVKLLRLKIADDLTITTTPYKDTTIDYTKLESWQDTINRYNTVLRERERERVYN